MLAFLHLVTEGALARPRELGRLEALAEAAAAPVNRCDCRSRLPDAFDAVLRVPALTPKALAARLDMVPQMRHPRRRRTGGARLSHRSRIADWRRSSPWRQASRSVPWRFSSYQKRFAPGKPITLLTALVLAQQKQFSRAWTMLEADRLEAYPAAARWLFISLNPKSNRGGLGHVSLDTTNHYAEISIKMKQEALEACQAPSVSSMGRPRRPIWQSDPTLLEWLASL